MDFGWVRPMSGGGAAQVSEVWAAPWGALATSPSQLAMGVSTTQYIQPQAKREAMDQCKRGRA